MVAEIFFIAAGLLAVIAALGMLVSRSPVRSALWLILVMLCVAGLYMTLSAEFIAVVQVLVYAGAIMVLFLFVIMLLNLGALPNLERVDFKKGVGFVLGTVILAQLVYITATASEPLVTASFDPSETGSALKIAEELFTRYALPFEIIGILLLVATVGAVMLAKRTFE
ncbi:MAG: NADH-quinone oxidoreductase subunit J [Rhodothermaceae bacterium]|nr:NADH-quinone oxidoreductase subunit J [Rhodothermaceae bacterium]MYF63420.1 NADH-quinone oxidoreductase subunit J [Rhodothermaceae bacterium]MYI83752.1 NADH-quinone oxidoreductase subunit J [Rhodothermaceae bacterium]